MSEIVASSDPREIPVPFVGFVGCRVVGRWRPRPRTRNETKKKTKKSLEKKTKRNDGENDARRSPVIETTFASKNGPTFLSQQQEQNSSNNNNNCNSDNNNKTSDSKRWTPFHWKKTKITKPGFFSFRFAVSFNQKRQSKQENLSNFPIPTQLGRN